MLPAHVATRLEPSRQRDVLPGARSAETGPPWPRRYVALGDSYCVGLETDGFQPWPTMVADGLRRDSPELTFYSLGRYGATSADVVAAQLPLAIAVEPDLVTVACGANDVLRTVSPDAAAFARNLGKLLRGLRGALFDTTILTITYGRFDAFMPYRPRSRQRVASGIDRVNEVIRELSAEVACGCVDLAAADTRRAEYFGPDGVHPSELGHVRTADAVMEAVRDRT